MEIIFVKALQFVLAISLLVLLHEGGHMFFAKLFGIRVEKFYVFFDVSIGKWGGSLFHFKPKNSDTDYGLLVAIARLPAWWTKVSIPSNLRSRPNLGSSVRSLHGSACW